MVSRTIDPRYVPTTHTVAANTPSSSPQNDDPGLGDVIVDEVEIFIPPGHQGLTGLAVVMAGVHIVPYGADTDFVLGNDQSSTFAIGVEVGNGLVVALYNEDAAFEHTFYLRWKVRSLDSQPDTGTTPTPAATPLPITSTPTP